MFSAEESGPPANVGNRRSDDDLPADLLLEVDPREVAPRERLRAEQHRIAVVFAFGIVLYPSFGVLDAMIYPQALDALLLIRAVVVIAVFLALLAIRRVGSLSATVWVSGIAFGIAGLGIVAMVALTEGAASPYYAGICLVVICASVLFSWPLWVSIVVYGVVLSGYLFAVVIHPFDPLQLTTNLFFLVPTLAIGALGTVVRGRLADRETEARIELAESNAQLARLATHDPLTGLRNRRGLVEKLQEILSLNKRFGHVSSVAMLDLDNFKAVNDVLGHSAGDDLLKRIALVLRANTRETDFVYRVGGDEFLTVFQNSDAEACTLALRRIQACIRQITDEPALARVQAGASVGLIEVIYSPGHLETGQDVADAADRSMYQAKRGSGTNEGRRTQPR